MKNETKKLKGPKMNRDDPNEKNKYTGPLNGRSYPFNQQKREKIMEAINASKRDNPIIDDSEVLDFIDHLGVSFHLGKCIECILKYRKKGVNFEDLLQAMWHLKREMDKQTT